MIARRALALVLAAGLCAERALATWSIVVVDRRTREVCVATATCVEGNSLDDSVPLIRVEEGAAAAQAFVHANASNRKIIWAGFKAGKAPLRILDEIVAADAGIDMRQFGIVSFVGDPVTFTGDGLNAFHSQWAGGLTGEAGDLLYAIQGNVLTGAPVVLEAERALLETEGDLSQRVMAAMMAAWSMGGDGRCSCAPSDADGCGAPPPDFEKTAHQAVFALARPGDKNGKCNGDVGCADGEYYVRLHETGGEADPDPVVRLRASYEAWRAALAGVPDHYRSEVRAGARALVADGLSSTTVTVRLVDVDGVPLAQGGATLKVKALTAGPETARAGPVTDHGDGSYSFALTATANPGRGVWELRVTDHGGPRPVALRPLLVVQTAPLADLAAGHDLFSASEDEALAFWINRGPAQAGRPYRVLGTFSGTVPGFDLGGLHVPLNRDALFHLIWTSGGGPPFEGSLGVLDADGRAEASLALTPPAWGALVGERLHFAALLTGGASELTNLVSVEVLP